MKSMGWILVAAAALTAAPARAGWGGAGGGQPAGCVGDTVSCYALLRDQLLGDIASWEVFMRQATGADAWQEERAGLARVKARVPAPLSSERDAEVSRALTAVRAARAEFNTWESRTLASLARRTGWQGSQEDFKDGIRALREAAEALERNRPFVSQDEFEARRRKLIDGLRSGALALGLNFEPGEVRVSVPVIEPQSGSLTQPVTVPPVKPAQDRGGPPPTPVLLASKDARISSFARHGGTTALAQGRPAFGKLSEYISGMVEGTGVANMLSGFGIHPMAFILALTKSESDFKQRAVSDIKDKQGNVIDHAYGPMQVLAETAVDTLKANAAEAARLTGKPLPDVIGRMPSGAQMTAAQRRAVGSYLISDQGWRLGVVAGTLYLRQAVTALKDLVEPVRQQGMALVSLVAGYYNAGPGNLGNALLGRSIRHGTRKIDVAYYTDTQRRQAIDRILADKNVGDSFIPIRETRLYTRKIQTWYAQLRAWFEEMGSVGVRPPYRGA